MPLSTQKKKSKFAIEMKCFGAFSVVLTAHLHFGLSRLGQGQVTLSCRKFSASQQTDAF